MGYNYWFQIRLSKTVGRKANPLQSWLKEFSVFITDYNYTKIRSYMWSQITSPYYFIVVYISHLQLHTVSRKSGKLSSGHRTSGQFSLQSQKRQYQRILNYHTVVLIPHTSKVMLKILQARLQQYVNPELPDVQAGCSSRGTRDQIANICWIIEKARELQKNIYFCFIDYAKAFDCVENSERDGNTRPPDLPPDKSVCRSRSNS